MSEGKLSDGHRHVFRDCCGEWLRMLSRRPANAPGLCLPSIDNRLFWDSLEPELQRQIVKRGEAAADRSFPSILMSDYMDFSKTGIRSRFEKKYFERRRMLVALVLAECVQNNGHFISSILDGVYLIMEETTWCLPAHNNYVRDTVQFPVPDPSRPVIDLFAAETGAILSVLSGLLKSRFDSISPFIMESLGSRIKERIVVPYLSFHFWWMGDGIQPMLNWTPWITQNVLLSVFSQARGFVSPDQEKRILEQAAVSLDYFLDEYGEDGCCNEGAQYFGHAGLCLFGCIDVLRRLTGDSLSGICSLPLIRNMADYILRVYAGSGYYFNFADCSPHPGHRSARDYLSARYTCNEALAGFAAADYRSCSWEERLLPEEENLFYHLLQLENHEAMMNTPDQGLRASDSWFESTGILIARDAVFSLAARAGSNGDSHNHNDVGSVILYVKGQPFLVDLGVETYTKKTFSADRYDIWTMQSSWHNLPTFYDGDAAVQQKAGPEYRAASVSHRISDEESWLAMDLAPLYEDARIRSYRRKVTLIKEDSVRIEDTYDGDLPCRLSLILLQEPVVEKGTESCFHVDLGLQCSLDIEGASDILLEKRLIEDPKLRNDWGAECFRLQVCFSDKNSVVCSCHLEAPHHGA